MKKLFIFTLLLMFNKAHAAGGGYVPLSGGDDTEAGEVRHIVPEEGASEEGLGEKGRTLCDSHSVPEVIQRRINETVRNYEERIKEEGLGSGAFYPFEVDGHVYEVSVEVSCLDKKEPKRSIKVWLYDADEPRLYAVSLLEVAFETFYNYHMHGFFDIKNIETGMVYPLIGHGLGYAPKEKRHDYLTRALYRVVKPNENPVFESAMLDIINDIAPPKISVRIPEGDTPKASSSTFDWIWGVFFGHDPS